MSNLSFTKLFSSITDSSVWQESSDVRVVWVTLMAMSDPLGRVHAAIPGLARRANVSREATEMALAVFLSPDPDSRSKDHDGRRIEEIPGGWRLLNYSAYRELRDEEARKEQNRLAQSKYRQKVSQIVSKDADSKHTSANVSGVSNSKPASAQVEVEVEVENTTAGAIEAISPEMVASGVMTELCLSTRDLAVTLDGVCRAEMKKGRDATELRDALIGAYQEWEIAKPRLNYTKSTKNFFGEGDWRNKTGWPWKPGESPPIRKPSAENKALQAIKEREEAVRRERGT